MTTEVSAANKIADMQPKGDGYPNISILSKKLFHFLLLSPFNKTLVVNILNRLLSIFTLLQNKSFLCHLLDDSKTNNISS